MVSGDVPLEETGLSVHLEFSAGLLILSAEVAAERRDFDCTPWPSLLSNVEQCK